MLRVIHQGLDGVQSTWRKVKIGDLRGPAFYYPGKMANKL